MKNNDWIIKCKECDALTQKMRMVINHKYVYMP